jgi:uroporphyrin-III C-methyltransferase
MREPRPTSGVVHLVGAGPGDPGLLTVKGLSLLRRADAVVHDRLVDLSLLDEAPEGAERIDVGKAPGRHALRQEEINALLVELARRGLRVVRLKGGDPFVFGRGGEECESLAAADIPFEVVPGVSSAFAAPAAAGIPLTHRGLAGSFTVVTGHRAGDAPDDLDWTLLVRSETLVVLMGVQTLPLLARRLIEHGRPADTPVAAVHAGTTPAQSVVTALLGELVDPEGPAARLRAPATIVIGAVAALAHRLAPTAETAGELLSDLSRIAALPDFDPPAWPPFPSALLLRPAARAQRTQEDRS